MKLNVLSLSSTMKERVSLPLLLVSVYCLLLLLFLKNAKDCVYKRKKEVKILGGFMYAHVNISVKGKTRKKEHRFNEKRVQKKKKEKLNGLRSSFSTLQL